MPIQMCAITGTVYDVLGAPVPNYEFRIVRIDKNGQLMSNQRRTVVTDEDGNLDFQLPRNSSAWFHAPVVGLDDPKTGVRIIIPDAASAVLSDLLPPQQGSPPQTFVFSFNGRPGAVVLNSADIIAALGYTPGNAGNSLVGASYVYTQNSPAAVWTITHNFNSYPSVTVVDSAGTHVIGQVEYLTANQIRLTFSAAFSGRAFLN